MLLYLVLLFGNIFKVDGILSMRTKAYLLEHEGPQPWPAAKGRHKRMGKNTILDSFIFLVSGIRSIFSLNPLRDGVMCKSVQH